VGQYTIYFRRGADLSIEVYRRTLYQPYHVHVARNSSEVISGITNKVGGTVLGVLLPLMTLLSSSMLLVAIPVALIAIDPLVALGGYRRLWHELRGHHLAVAPPLAS